MRGQQWLESMTDMAVNQAGLLGKSTDNDRHDKKAVKRLQEKKTAMTRSG
jgi:hypothetical protein